MRILCAKIGENLVYSKEYGNRGSNIKLVISSNSKIIIDDYFSDKDANKIISSMQKGRYSPQDW